MSMRQAVRRTTGGQIVVILLFGLLGSVAVTATVVAVAVNLRTPEQQANRVTERAPPAPAAPAAQALPAQAPGQAHGQAPGAAMMRPLPMPQQNRQVSAQRAPDGHFYFDTSLNGATIRMMFDTGASTVSLRSEDAARAGIAVNALNYSVVASTANGTTTLAPVMLDTFRVGDITRRNVLAWVARPGKQDVSLLGQTFMSKLSGYRVENGELILRGD